MKTYCKRLVVADVVNIYNAISGYMADKYRKASTIRFYACYTGHTRDYIRENLKPNKERLVVINTDDFADGDFWRRTNLALAVEMAEHIRTRTVKEHLYELSFGSDLIRYSEITDHGSGKRRLLGLETVLFRLYETVAQAAAEPLFKAKLGTYQCASVKGRGQNYGKKAVRKWIATDVEGTKYYGKADVRHCYPSIPHPRLRRMLRRDLRKSCELLYIFETFLDVYEEWPSPESVDPEVGILIGSPVSKELCNYYLSYVYHYMDEHLVKTVSRRGKTVTKRLISHDIFYMDDIVMYGSNKKDLRTAIAMVSAYMEKELGMQIKEDWIITKTMYEDADGKRHGAILDYMGFRFHAGKVKAKEYFGRKVRIREIWTTIRRHIFLKSRRKISRFVKMVRHHENVGIRFARSLTSQYGWFKNTDMILYRRRYKLDAIMRIARKIVSDAAKGKPYNNGKYYKMWRCKCA